MAFETVLYIVHEADKSGTMECLHLVKPKLLRENSVNWKRLSTKLVKQREVKLQFIMSLHSWVNFLKHDLNSFNLANRAKSPSRDGPVLKTYWTQTHRYISYVLKNATYLEQNVLDNSWSKCNRWRNFCILRNLLHRRIEL